MTGLDMLQVYDVDHFHKTQLPGQENYFSSVEVRYGVQHNMQISRLSALKCMHENTISALLRDQCLIGSDAGNTLAFYGFSYYQELCVLLEDVRVNRNLLLKTATEKAQQFFSYISQRPHIDFLEIGSYANFNLIPAEEILPVKMILSDCIYTQHGIKNHITKTRKMNEE